MKNTHPLRVCIDACAPDGPASGERAIIAGLAAGFSQLTDGDEEYLFLALKSSHEWLKPHVSGHCRILPLKNSASRGRYILKQLPGLCQLWQLLKHLVVSDELQMPMSDGTIEAAGVDVMHFVQTTGFQTSVASMYQIHDLQHLHHPEYFSPKVLKERDFWYRTLCDLAKVVTVPSKWGKSDLVARLGVPEEKITVVPWAPVLDGDLTPSPIDLAVLRQKYALPPAFGFYPAHTWPHKNHLCLFEAIAIARDRYGCVIPIVCSGGRDNFVLTINKRVQELNLENQVKYVGFVSSLELKSLYRLSRFVVFPTLFEGWGLPLLEAFLTKTAMACSDISPLKEQASDAASKFDPHDPSELADVLHTLWTNEQLRTQLIERGTERVKLFTWGHTARILRAQYRAVAQRQLSTEDVALLAEPPLV